MDYCSINFSWHDGLPPIIVEKSAFELAPLLSGLFQKSDDSCKSTMVWRPYLEHQININSNILKAGAFRWERSTTDLLTFITYSWGKTLIYHGKQQVITLDILKAIPSKLCTSMSCYLSDIRISMIVHAHSFILFNQCRRKSRISSCNKFIPSESNEISSISFQFIATQKTHFSL